MAKVAFTALVLDLEKGYLLPMPSVFQQSGSLLWITLVWGLLG